MEAGPSRPRSRPSPVFPMGDSSVKNGGEGIFYNPASKDSLDIWVDTALHSRIALIKTLESENARIATQHWDEDVRVMIMSPQSTAIFDMYCHPDWLNKASRKRYEKKRRRLHFGDDWDRKVMLKDVWVKKCLEAGRFLGTTDDWGGCRVGTAVLDDEPSTPGVAVPEPHRLPTPVSQTTEADNANAAEPVTPLQGIGDAEAVEEEMAVDASVAPPVETAAPDPGGGPGVQEDEAPTSAVTENDQENPSVTVEVTVDSVPANDGGEQEGMPPVLAGTFSSQPMDIDTLSPPSTIPKGQDGEPVPPASPSQSQAGATSLVSPSRTQQPASPISPVYSKRRRDESSEAEEEVEEVEWPPTAGSSGRRGDPESSQMAGGEAPPENETAEGSGNPTTAEGGNDEVAQEVDMSSDATENDLPIRPAERLFEGLKFWVDPQRPRRTDIMTRIKAAGGSIVSDYTDATHVLVHHYAPARWDSIIAQIRKRGIWFMPFSWLVKCLDDNVRHSERGQHVPGGVPTTSAEAASISPTRRRPRRTPISPVSNRNSPVVAQRRSLEIAPSSTASSSRVSPTTAQRATFASAASPSTATPSEMTVTQLCLAFDAAQQYLTREGTCNELNIIQHVMRAHPDKYSFDEWSNLLVHWKKRTDRFRDVPKNAKAALPLNTARLREIFGELQTEEGSDMEAFGRIVVRLKGKYKGAYTKLQWARLWGDWRHEAGRFAKNPDPNAVHARQEEERLEGQASQSPVRGRMNDLSMAEIKAILEQEYPKIDGKIASIVKMAEQLAELHPKYSVETWTGDILDWKAGKGRFAPSPVTSSSSGSPSMPTGAALPVAGLPISTPTRASSRYLSDERLAEIFAASYTLIQAGEPVAPQVEKWRAEYGSYTTGTWQIFFRNWKRGGGKFATYGAKWKYTPRHQIAVSAESSTSSPPNASPRATVPSAGGFRPSVETNRMPYTHDEEMAMAEHVARRRPLKTGTGPADWREFADTYQKRTAAAYGQHYMAHQGKIDVLADYFDEDVKPPETLIQGSTAIPGPTGPVTPVTEQMPDSAGESSATASARSSALQAIRSSRGGRNRKPWTEDEERKMARWIYSRLPDPTPANQAAWTGFAHEFPNRSLGAITLHYTSHRPAIKRYVDELRRQAGDTDDSDSVPDDQGPEKDDDSVVYIEAPSDREDADFVDMTADDSD